MFAAYRECTTGSNSVSVINTATDTVTATIHVGCNPDAIAVTPGGTRAYVANYGQTNCGPSSASVISTATNHVTTTIRGLCGPYGVAASPDGTHIYVTNNMSPGTVSVITRQ